MNTKIYSKTGDKGMTSLRGGTRVPKNHKRIEVNGNVDELISYMGLIRSQDIGERDKQMILKIQDRLMTYAALIATDSKTRVTDYPVLNEDDVNILEGEIDSMEKNLPRLQNFVLPGGHTAVSFIHVARTVCRRAERKIVELSSEEPVPEFLIKYFNRLSDYLFVLARKTAFNLKVKEIQWTTKL
jgi:cob(I)alamin adenosyltransferase